MFFKSVNGMAPVYITYCFKLHVPSRNFRSSKDCLRHDYPRTQLQAGDFLGKKLITREPIIQIPWFLHRICDLTIYKKRWWRLKQFCSEGKLWVKIIKKTWILPKNVIFTFSIRKLKKPSGLFNTYIRKFSANHMKFE